MTSSVPCCCERKGTMNSSIFNRKVYCSWHLWSNVRTELTGNLLHFATFACRTSSRLQWNKKCRNVIRLAEIIVKNKLCSFYGSLCRRRRIMQTMGWFGSGLGQSRSSAMSPFYGAHATSYTASVSRWLLTVVAKILSCDRRHNGLQVGSWVWHTFATF